MTVKFTNAVAAAKANAALALANGGTVEIRTGAAPTNAEDTATGTLLATLTFSATAFGTPTSTAGANAVATANSITGDSSADATGTAAHFRVKSSGGTALWQGTVGTSGADMNLTTTSLVAGQPVNITSWTYTEPVAGA